VLDFQMLQVRELGQKHRDEGVHTAITEFFNSLGTKVVYFQILDEPNGKLQFRLGDRNVANFGVVAGSMLKHITAQLDSLDKRGQFALGHYALHQGRNPGNIFIVKPTQVNFRVEVLTGRFANALGDMREPHEILGR
jgi:hypothetical protein